MEKTGSLLKRIFINKYVFTLVAFTVFVTFFDEYNLIARWRTARKIVRLERELKLQEEEIRRNKEKLKDLQSSDENLEKFAREQFLMKRENEDIFIIKE